MAIESVCLYADSRVYLLSLDGNRAHLLSLDGSRVCLLSSDGNRALLLASSCCWCNRSLNFLIVGLLRSCVCVLCSGESQMIPCDCLAQIESFCPEAGTAVQPASCFSRSSISRPLHCHRAHQLLQPAAGLSSDRQACSL